MSRIEDGAALEANSQPGEELANEINHMIDAIPTDTPPEFLPDRLRFIIEGLAMLESPRAEVCLHKIRARFRLKREDVEAYRRQVRSKQKEREKKTAADSTPKLIMTAEFPSLVELALSGGKTVFLVQEGNRLKVENSLESDGSRLVPPSSAQLPWLIPRAEEILLWYKNDTDADLYEDLLAYHRGISELPTDAHYHLLVLWVLHSHLLEWFQYSPVLWLYGVPERGKSRTGKGLIHVARRGIHVESLREAYLLRAAQDLKASLFIDVMDLSRKLERSGSEDILLQRFEKGAHVPRVLYPDKGPYRDTVYYKVFGATIIGTNEPIHHILETRSIPITLPYARRTFENEITPEGGQVLRERLAAFRARHLGTEPPSVEKPARGRLGDILKPLLQIAALVRPERLPVIMELFRELQVARLNQKADSLEAQTLLAVQACIGMVKDGMLPVSEVVQRLNRDRSEKEHVTSQKVGRRLGALGFQKTKTVRNCSAISWDPERLVRLMASYGLQKTPETPETPGLHSHNELGAGVVPQAAFPALESPGAVGELRPASDCEAEQLENAGVSGVSRRFFQESLHREKEFDAEDFEERAAIMEFDGNMPHAVAEARAKSGNNGFEQ